MIYGTDNAANGRNNSSDLSEVHHSHGPTNQSLPKISSKAKLAAME
jgi:hypothetical protein